MLPSRSESASIASDLASMGLSASRRRPMLSLSSLNEAAGRAFTNASASLGFRIEDASLSPRLAAVARHKCLHAGRARASEGSMGRVADQKSR